MNVEIEIIKGLPVEQIQKFEDKTVYNCAVYTREMTKGSNAYPYFYSMTLILPFCLLPNWGEKSLACQIPEGEGGSVCLHLLVSTA